MTRRRFLAAAAAFVAALAPIVRCAPGVGPRPAWRAARAARYPGPVRPLDRTALRCPASRAG